MRGDRFGAVRGDVVRLFEGESVAGLAEGELLDRFATRRDEAAFEALVNRLGPMVLGICRRMLADPHDVDDAFQATFLVLIRKVDSIRDRDLVGPWLYGVALKVARRARAESTRRKARERDASEAESVEGDAAIDSGWTELRALIDEEIGRLPEDHRRAVVLCDVEGLSREEAALRLGWTLNMVRGRLERARGRLRGRLAQPGVAPTGAWAALMVAPSTPSPALLAATVRAALAFSSGRMATGLASASAVALSQGVSRMMMLSKVKVGLAVLLSAGFVAGGSGMLAAQGPGDKPGAEVSKVAAPPVQVLPGPAGAFQPRPAADLARARVEAALQRFKTQLAFYDEGRITIDRLVDASRGLMQAEVNAAGSKDARVAAARTHYDRLAEILKKEQAELEVGRATQADVAEIQSGLLDAELTLANELATPETNPAIGDEKAGSSPPAATRPSRDKERVEIARRLYHHARELYTNARAEIAVALEAAVALAKAEEGAARTKDERVAAVRNQVDRLKEIVAVSEQRVKAARSTTIDVDQALLRLLDAESHLLDVSGTTPEGTAPAPIPADRSSLPGPRAWKPRNFEPRQSLKLAVEEFNARASKDEVGRQERALTEAEVIAAIQLGQPPHDPPVFDPFVADFRGIAETGQLPAGATLSFKTLMDPGGDFLIDGWWIRIEMADADGKANSLSIRSQVFRSVPLEKASERAYVDSLKFGQAADPTSRAKALQLRALVDSLEERIERSKAKREKAIAPAPRR